jgi:iron complex transport system substrate-binding protein
MPRARQATLALIFVLASGLAWAVHSCGAALERRGRDGAEGRITRERIAILSPAAVEIAFAIGAGDRVVGVTRFATHPPAAKELPDIGGVLDINYERLSALAPDLIIAQTTDPRLADFATQRGIALLAAEIETADDVLEACRLLGRELDLPARGARLAGEIEAALAAVEARTAGLPAATCFISVDRGAGTLTGLLTAGRGTFLTEMVTRVGGRNVFEDIPRRYPVVSKETLLARAPEVVLEFKPGADPGARQIAALTSDWQRLPGLPAVRADRIHVIHHDDALLPGPRIAEVAREVSRALHPEAWHGEGGAP